ncbi:MAG TPA: hypothetical protein VN957_10310 [Chthoniobacterales bacterium]|jgi:hypothetical protein|nr:hypothetical protein [Chthoniobacterales bacterium]
MAIALAGERRFLERLKSEEEATVVYTAPKERFMKLQRRKSVS